MTGINIKNEHELALMREAGRIVAEVLARVQEIVAPGMTTADIEAVADQIIVGKHKAIPSFKGYRGYPSLICTSVNDEIVHGIPGKRVLKRGDIVSVDVGVVYRGYQGDAAITVPVGQVDAESQRLMDVTVEALRCGIEACRPGNWTSDISKVVQEYVEGQGLSVVREYTGHGIGRDMHEDPQIPNYYDPKMGRYRLRPGMTFALEPMVNTKGWQTRVLNDKWTVVTADGGRSAHFEHTIAVTKNDPMILTEL
jgi:methionyl aminopeptidase